MGNALDSQEDFTGGENSVGDKVYIAPNEYCFGLNVYPVRGRGLVARAGYNTFATLSNDAPGRAVFEFDQSTGTILTRVAATNSWYDETMQPSYKAFGANPQVGDEIYFGSREPFYELVMTVLGLVSTDYVFTWYGSNGAGGWIDITSTIVESVANAKKWAANPVTAAEVILNWPGITGHGPQQVETRTYQYWIKSTLTTVGTPTGADVEIQAKRIRGDWEGRRLHLAASTKRIDEVPGTTLTARNVDAWTYVPRMRAAQLGDYFYMASDGIRNLKRWNGCRGVTRSGFNNTPADAGLVAPNAAPVLTPVADANSYLLNAVIRYRLSYEFGPEGILGEGPASPSAQVTSGAGFKVTVDFTAAKTQASSLEVYSILIYATYDVSGITSTAERDRLSGFIPILRVVRDDANWVAGTISDTALVRFNPGINPVDYTNTPPFRPKYIVSGGNRLWISDGVFVAWSDLGRGDSWNPFNIVKFGGVRQLFYHEDRCLVFQREDIQVIEGVNESLPRVRYLWHGLGTVQPDSVTKGDGALHFISARGPAMLVGDTVRTTGRQRVWESADYWNQIAGERALAQGAYFQDRWWIPVDQGGANAYVSPTVAAYDQPHNAWSHHQHVSPSAGIERWGALSVIHAPLDHALARNLILVGYPDYDGTNLASDACKIRCLEYGTTDGWTTLVTDGQKIAATIRTHALQLFVVVGRRFVPILKFWKNFGMFHMRLRLPNFAATPGTIYANLQLLADQGTVNSTTVVVPGDNTKLSQDVKDMFTEIPSGTGTKTQYREAAPQLQISVVTDKGFELTSFYIEADADPDITP